MKNYFNQALIEEFPNTVKKDIVLSVCVTAYNHEKFIKECLNNILNQKTNFKFEILIGEDDSEDETRIICKEFAYRYPDKIRLFLHRRDNVIDIDGNSTGRFNFIYNIKNARGKYIALCEADDYWSDPLKLQKQVDFLEVNKEVIICGHSVVAKSCFENTEEKWTVKEDHFIEFKDCIEDNRFMTLSVVFRNLINEFPNWFYFKTPVGDWPLFLLLLEKGKGFFMKDIMGVYRIHENGLWSRKTNNEKQILKLKMYTIFKEVFPKYRKEFETILVRYKISEKIF